MNDPNPNPLPLNGSSTPLHKPHTYTKLLNGPDSDHFITSMNDSIITRYENLMGILNCQMCVLKHNIGIQNTHLTIQNPH